jgi:hypothetical protein
MKKYLIIFTLLAFSYSFSQIKTPQPSPAASMNQMVGLTEIEVEYSRPSMRGREIFGNLVPYGKIWRTGANASTKISFSTNVEINGKMVAAGKYSVFTIPNEPEWEFILYNDTSVRGVPGDWDDKNVVLSTMVEMKKLPEPILRGYSANNNHTTSNVEVQVEMTNKNSQDDKFSAKVSITRNDNGIQTEETLTFKGSEKEVKDKIDKAVSGIEHKHSKPISTETFTIGFEALNNNNVVLSIMWDDVYVPITIDVPTREMVEKNIQDVMGKQPTASDYYDAAVYYMQENINIEKAVEWIDKAIEMSEKPQFWQLRQQSLIYAANGDLKGAVRIAKKSLESSKIAGNQDYVKMNKDSIEEWSN